MTEYIYQHELFSFFLVFLSTRHLEYIGKVQLAIYFFPQLSNAQLSVPHGGLGKEAGVGCSAMLYLTGEGGRKRSLTVIIDIITIIKLPRFPSCAIPLPSQSVDLF